jgi:hypothetical protein
LSAKDVRGCCEKTQRAAQLARASRQISSPACTTDSQTARDPLLDGDAYLDGLLAEPEYNLGIIMREDPIELLDGDPHERARRLAARTGLDATGIWDWGVVERVSTGLLGTKVGLQPVARQMLAAADIVCLRTDTAST